VAYESETFDTIMERMLARLPDDIDKSEGSPIYDMLAPAAIELEQAYMEMDNVLNLGFADTTYGEYLDRRAAEQGLTRKAAVAATGEVTVTGPEGTLIPAGTVFATSGDSPIYFEATIDATISGGSANISIQAQYPGAAGNVDAGKITVMVGELADVISVTNDEPTSGGIDEESDDELLARYIEKVSTPITSGNKYQYEQWAKSITGVSDAKCYPLWNGPGTVKVVLVDEEKRSPSQSIIDAVTNYIESQRPIGASVTVVGVTEVPIDISADLTLQAGVSIDDVKTQITNNLTSYFKTVAFADDSVDTVAANDGVVRYSKIANAIYDASGVIDYANLRVNGGAANIVLNDDEVPVVGAVLVTQAQN
jgi:uncharacterized phage protein gp47/JayE